MTKPKPVSKPVTPGQYVSQCRRALKLTQVDLAAHLGLTVQAINAWERDRAPIPKARVLELRTALDMNGSTLVDLMTAAYRAKLVKAIKAQKSS